MAKNRLKTSCTTRLIHCFPARSSHSSRKRLTDIGLHLPATLKRKAKSTKSVATPPRTESSRILHPSVWVAVETKFLMAGKYLSRLLALPGVHNCVVVMGENSTLKPEARKLTMATGRKPLDVCSGLAVGTGSGKGRCDCSTNPNKQFTSLRTPDADMQRGRPHWYLPLSSW